MARVTITVRDNGPYKLDGEFILVDAAGNEVPFQEPLALCRCGQSGNKPFCDASHKRVGFESAPRAG